MPTRNALLLTAAAVLTGLTGLAGCGDDDEPDTRLTASPSPTTTSATSSPTPTPTASSVPSLPPQATELRQGGSYQAVYLAVSAGSSVTAENRQAESAAKALGYQAGTGDVDCDQGARQALGLPETGSYLVTSVLFTTDAQAQTFVAAYQPEVVGTAQVELFCLD